METIKRIRKIKGEEVKNKRHSEGDLQRVWREERVALYCMLLDLSMIGNPKLSILIGILNQKLFVLFLNLKPVTLNDTYYLILKLG